MALAPRWLRARTGVRVASALSAAAVVTVALVIAGAALILLVGNSLSRSVQADALQQAQAIATRMHGNYGKRVDEQYTPKENAVEAIDTLIGTGDPAVAQIMVDYSDDQKGDGWALQTGSDSSPPIPISDLAPDVGKTAVMSSASVPLSGHTTMHAVLVAVGGFTTTDDALHFVVLYAAPLAAVDAAQNTVLYYLLFGVPILILVVGAATYVFAGRALQPVEAIRARVASMSGKDLAQRVPVPMARDEVGRLAETMNEMIGRLESAQDVQRRFVADASHELRSPLSTIGAGLELLQDAGSDPATVTALRGETARLGRLVDDLLLLARADERGIQPRHDEVDLDEIVEAERTRPSDDDLRVEVRAEHVRVIGDRGQLIRVLRNLVDNAHRHARSQVLVTLSREGDHAALSVADDGPGVPAADRLRVFERFVRLDDARARADGGSGLGLAIVAEVVAAHGGRVWVDQNPGGGALFRVRLPAAELPAAEDDVDALPAALTTGPHEPEADDLLPAWVPARSSWAPPESTDADDPFSDWVPPQPPEPVTAEARPSGPSTNRVSPGSRRAAPAFLRRMGLRHAHANEHAREHQPFRDAEVASAVEVAPAVEVRSAGEVASAGEVPSSVEVSAVGISGAEVAAVESSAVEAPVADVRALVDQPGSTIR